MQTIIPIAKYDETSQRFIKSINPDERLKALSKITTLVISNEDDEHFDYILFAYGNRAENVTHDGTHPIERRDYCQRIADYFRSKGKNVLIESVLLDKDSPLSIETMLIAGYLDDIASEETLDTINVIGHSKCGAMAFNLPKYFQNEDSFKKTSITTTATPYKGCLMATPTIFLSKVKAIINAQLPPPLNKVVFNSLKNYYNSISSGSHMDNDIALPGYVAEHYDPSFIADMFDIKNISAINKVRKFRNFTTRVDDGTLIKYLKKRDFTSVGMCLIDKFFMDEPTDGFIEIDSQESVNYHFDHPSIHIPSTTHYFLTHPDEMAVVLDTVNSDIDDYKEREAFKQKISSL